MGEIFPSYIKDIPLGIL